MLFSFFTFFIVFSQHLQSFSFVLYKVHSSVLQRSFVCVRLNLRQRISALKKPTELRSADTWTFVRLGCKQVWVGVVHLCDSSQRNTGMEKHTLFLCLFAPKTRQEKPNTLLGVSHDAVTSSSQHWLCSHRFELNLVFKDQIHHLVQINPPSWLLALKCFRFLPGVQKFLTLSLFWT